MAQLIYKPRPKIPSWSPPVAPKPKRNYFYWWAVTAWLLVVGIGYHFLPIDWGERSVTRDSESAPSPAPASIPEQTSVSGIRASNDVVVREPEENTSPVATKPASTEILSCEEFADAKSIAPEGRLPMHLGRSALDAFIGENDWAKPCRGKHRQTVQLCVAILDGAVRGLTLKSVRPNLTLENCLREQAKKLVLAPESSLRIVNTTFWL